MFSQACEYSGLYLLLGIGHCSLNLLANGCK